MSGLRDMNLTKAYALLHERGETTLTLADKLDTSRSYVSRMLAGSERRGKQWRRLCRLLTVAEIELLMAVPEREPAKTMCRQPQKVTSH